MLLRFARIIVALLPLLVMASRIDDALELQQKGKLKEARELLQTAATEYRAAGDRHNLARALSVNSRIAISLGDYDAATKEAQQSIDMRRALKEDAGLSDDFNTLGLASQYRGNYPAALQNYELALKADQSRGDADGEITRLNNIGNIFYFQGRYLDALHSYQEALVEVNQTTSEAWNPWRRQLTIANLATLYQRLGREEKALELYQQLGAAPQAMPANEYAQLLLNEGVMYRRMGDPIKALELYRGSQAVFATNHHADGEIGALRNIGIARAVDMYDLPGALEAFDEAVKLARQSSNNRGIVQARLYRGETLRRLEKLADAEADLRAALDGARSAGLIEEQWKALSALGQIAEDRGDTQHALDAYQKAVVIIESVRAGLKLPLLKSDFLADKRDVYDRLIALRLAENNPAPDEVFRWMERSRARTLLDRVASHSRLAELSLAEVESRLASDTVLVEFWMGSRTGAALWITSAGAGLVQYTSVDEIRRSAVQIEANVQSTSGKWKPDANSLGDHILAAIPLRRHILIVPDGPLNSVPFEILRVPGSDARLIERCDVSYLPSARFLAAPRTSQAKWAFPWRTQVVALGDPLVPTSDAIAGTEQWQSLPDSASEIRGIAHLLPGRSEIHLGSDARKRYLLGGRLAGIPMLHLSTHALVDGENPDRSRILLASDSAASVDYIFQEEVYDLNLSGVDLVAVSACDTARGKVVRGEGMQAFNQAFLAAGAATTITSLWRVADQPTASFMQQFYYALSREKSKAEALQDAKLQFLHSGSTLSNPRYWAAFVLTGDGWNATPHVIPWSSLMFTVAIFLGACGFLLRLRNSRSRENGREGRYGAGSLIAQESEHLNRLGG